MAALAGAPGSVERLAGVHRALLPRLSAAHAAHLEVTSAVADAPTMRTLRLVLADQDEDRRGGDRLLQGLLVGRDDVERAAAQVAALEWLLVQAGPLLG